MKWGCLAVAVLGSSPITRGKQLGLRRGEVARGLIPAHAGKTLSSRLLRFLARAHPRSCGENAALVTGTILPSGSSPLTRGKPRP